jgi:hypothetical protein
MHADRERERGGGRVGGSIVFRMCVRVRGGWREGGRGVMVGRGEKEGERMEETGGAGGGGGGHAWGVGGRAVSVPSNDEAPNTNSVCHAVDLHVGGEKKYEDMTRC